MKKKLLAALLAALLLLSLTACGGKKDSDKTTQYLPEEDSGMPSQELLFDPDMTEPPTLDHDSLYTYARGIAASSDSCTVSEPVVDGDTATYTVTSASSERFANGDGSYELVLRWSSADGAWRTDSDSSHYLSTEYHLNAEEFYADDYYWAAYPLYPTKSDPIYFTVTDLTDTSCTLTWWVEEYGYTQINGSCEGSGSFSLTRADEGEAYPCWIVEGVEVSTVKSGYSNDIPLTFRLKITPTKFSIQATGDSPKYISEQGQDCALSRIQNEAYYAAALEEVVRSGAHMKLAREVENELWTYSELIWDEDTLPNGSIELDGFRYVGALLMTEGNGYADRLFFLYGALVRMTTDDCYEPRLVTTYYPVFVKDAAVKNGVLTYSSVDLDYSIMDARETHIYRTTGGSAHVLMNGSATVEELLDYYERQNGRMFGSIDYIASSDASDPDVEEFTEWLRSYEAGKLGFSLAEDSCRITQVTEGGAAAMAGVRVGDVLIALNGNALPTDSYSARKILANAGNTESELTFRRDGTVLSFTLTRQRAS